MTRYRPAFAVPRSIVLATRRRRRPCPHPARRRPNRSPGSARKRRRDRCRHRPCSRHRTQPAHSRRSSGCSPTVGPPARRQAVQPAAVGGPAQPGSWCSLASPGERPPTELPPVEQPMVPARSSPLGEPRLRHLARLGYLPGLPSDRRLPRSRSAAPHPRLRRRSSTGCAWPAGDPPDDVVAGAWWSYSAHAAGGHRPARPAGHPAPDRLRAAGGGCGRSRADQSAGRRGALAPSGLLGSGEQMSTTSVAATPRYAPGTLAVTGSRRARAGSSPSVGRRRSSAPARRRRTAPSSAAP